MISLALALAAAGQSQLAMNQAAGADWKRADAAMNVQYRATMASMKAADAHPEPAAATGPTYAAALLASQRAWLAFRDAECFSEGYRYRGGSMAPMEVLGCKANLTRARTRQLHDLTVTP
jgi:uncharacterized protein YecT (DUF1311 family)